MHAVITVLHVVVCIFLVAVVLLQQGKGAQVGAVFGGGAGATMFGGRGAGNFLTKLTTGAAIVFMLTSLSLSYLGLTGASDRLFEQGAVNDAPAEDSLFKEIQKVPPEATPETGEPAQSASPTPETGEPAQSAIPGTGEPAQNAPPTPPTESPAG